MNPPGALPEALKTTAAAVGRLLEACRDAGVSLPQDPEFSRPLAQVLAFSDFVAESATREPMLLAELAASGELQRMNGAGSVAARLASVLSETADADDLGGRLRRFRRRELVRIAWRDIVGLADLTETTADLSALAEACLDQTLAWLHPRLCAELGEPHSDAGRPQRLVVVALGKLGARELNFSSDIDLVFAYPAPGQTRAAAAPVDNEEFFTRLARRLVQLIGQVTAEGFVFRVDLRLRPFGDGGPLVMSFDAMERYYQEQGRDWERYAWIKGRAVAGDMAAGEALLQRLHPFVYRRYLDFGAFESLRQMKQLISQEVTRKGMQANIKLGRGGIREIEFFGQIFQLIRGGVSPALQRRRIRSVLAALARQGTISATVRRELDDAYVFLRTVEHRLQQAADRQTHSLPADTEGLARLAAALGFATCEQFEAELKRHRDTVHGHFRMLLESGEAEGTEKAIESQLSSIWLQSVDEGHAGELLAGLGFDPPAEALAALHELRGDAETRALSLTGRQRLDRLVPLLLLESSRTGHPVTVLRRIIDLVRAIERRTSYLALLVEYPAALAHLARLANASPWIASFLARHPVLLDELLDARTLYRPPSRESLADDIGRRLTQAPTDDLESQIEALCIFKQIQVLRVAAADVSGTLPLMRVSDYLSDIAETIVNAVVNLAWEHLSAKHGTPVSRLGDAPCERGFAVIAYGKLGGLELGYGSDLDLVFLHAGVDGQTHGGARPIDNAQFYNRLGQRVIHLLTAHTRAGRVYEIDTRLRPSGISGILVRHIDAFRDYQLNEAWTWEHQALIKARAVCGDEQIGVRFEAIRAEALARRRPGKKLMAEVAEMRRRMRRELSRPEAGQFDLKHSPGGMIDIEFLVQALVLLLAHRHRELVRWTDNVRLIQALISAAVLNEYTAHLLKHAYLIYRAAAHQLSLQEQPSRVPQEKFERLQQRIHQIWQAVFREA
ncbi:MAG: bifunctional [glutamate--ammonia ligase]-adenylyl-L-tyrosine phosphorylase/[glutamate--ammonia-ligase] adenylyltransferase [Desulfobacterales bacterium]|jgi:glutamate-ammonia-ligase adenylyltransferase|nr:bifunctional [glutamate--ammonia ligase]-adenylyl-L-tyrosine phosphorylase/[glutamate--ammonia-ligase] adenylyltransferase [Desulfobacterales bacterium]